MVVSGLFLVALTQPIIQGFDATHSNLFRAVLVADIAAYSALYVVVLARGQLLNHRRRVWVVAALTVLGGVSAVMFRDPSNMTYLTYAIAAALMLWPLRWSRVFGLGIAALQMLLEWLVFGRVQLGDTATLVLLTVLLGFLFYLINTASKLRSAREDVAKLAVADERARLARDLHDVLGHSLTTITVKAGLARRVLESDADRERAISEVRDVEQLARQALTEVRATVSGYRKASLAAEMVGARAALTAAGITAELPSAVDDVAGQLQEPFAYVLREAVTNVIRHAGATRCEVRLGQSWLEIRDDGAGAQSIMDTPADSGGGHGLPGLRDRLSAVGGTLRAGPAAGGGYQLRAEVPPTAAERGAQPAVPGQRPSVRFT